jgi:hypothetical protein
MVIHELQAEPWPPNGLDIKNVSIDEQYKSMNPQRMKNRIKFGEATGMSSLDLWGAEWWYWLKVKDGDPRRLECRKRRCKPSRPTKSKARTVILG